MTNKSLAGAELDSLLFSTVIRRNFWNAKPHHPQRTS